MTANSNVETRRGAQLPTTGTMRTVRFEIYRYDPDKDAKPYMQELRGPLQPTDKMLLDALIRIKSDVDDSLSLRRSCREGVCGSDAMNINGKNGLACITNLRDLKEPIVLRPLPGLPVIRDLIVDMSQFFKQYHSIKPYLVNDDAAAGEGAAAVARGARGAQRPVRVHPVRLLLDLLPVLLVEPGQVRRPGRPAAGLPLHRRQPRPGHQRAARQPERPLPPVPLPHHHELRGRLPEGAESDPRDRQDQGHAGPPRGLTDGRRRDRRSRNGAAALALPAGGCWKTTSSSSRYLDRHERDLTVDDVLALEALLDLPDNELLDLLLARKEPAGGLDDNAVRTVLDGLRSV